MTWIYIIIVYISMVLLWFVVNLVAYFLSIALARPAIMHLVSGITQVIITIANFIIGILIIWYGFTLLANGNIFWLVVYVLIGASIISTLLSILQLPFFSIPILFSEKLKSIDFAEDVSTAELLDEKGNVVEKIEGNTTISRRLAFYFISFYALNLIGIYLAPDEGTRYLWGDYIVTPFLQILGGTFILGIPYSIYRKVKFGSFLTLDKRLFLIAVWRAWLIAGAALYILTFLLK